MDPESIRVEKQRVEAETDREVRGTWRELGSERVDASVLYPPPPILRGVQVESELSEDSPRSPSGV